MAAEPLTCAKCNEPLTISATTFSTSCTGCGQWHTIDRSGPVPVATPLGDPTAETPEPAPADAIAVSEPAEPTVDEVLQRLDEAWSWERKTYLVFGIDGGDTVPTFTQALVIVLVGAAIGAGLLYKTRGADIFSTAAGLALVVAGLALGGYRAKQAQTYQQAYQRYQRRRRASVKPKT